MNDLKWKGLRQEITELCLEINISSEQFSFLNEYEWENVYDNVLTNFVDGQYARKNGIHWANVENGFRKNVPEIYSFTLGQDNHLSYDWLKNLSKIVECEKVYLLLEEAGQQSKYWLSECDSEIVHLIINETAHVKDYYIIDKKYHWLISENHHDGVMFRGNLDIDLIKRNVLQAK